MILNVPDAAGLDLAARNLHFAAWTSVVEMLSDFRVNFDPEGSHVVPSTHSKEDWGDYVESCQAELQTIYTLLQQSNELALKARLAAVNPFLLLLGTEPKFGSKFKEVDFTSLRTMDAVDLPGAVNALSPKSLSERFVQEYTKIRSLRNKIAHIGQAGTSLTPHELIGDLFAQYAELWPERHWLRDRLQFASEARTSFFHDFKHQSPLAEVFVELPYTLGVMKKSQFKKLFRRETGTRRYFCLECIHDRTVYRAGLDVTRCETAYLNPNGSALECILCGCEFAVERVNCSSEGCKGNVIGSNGDDYQNVCHTCCQEQESDATPCGQL